MTGGDSSLCMAVLSYPLLLPRPLYLANQTHGYVCGLAQFTVAFSQAGTLSSGLGFTTAARNTCLLYFISGLSKLDVREQVMNAVSAGAESLLLSHVDFLVALTDSTELLCLCIKSC
jgi:hypothetical protein